MKKNSSDTPLTDKEWQALGPAIHGIAGLPAEAKAAIKRMGRPLSKNPKQKTTLRLDSDIIAAFKRDGAGWQTRINDVLRANMPTS